jgi:AAA+ ATPase superfamily predicted ATPase
MQDFSDKPKLYIFISRKNEALLCQELLLEIENKLGVTSLGTYSKLEDVLKWLFSYSQNHPLTLIIDEFQDMSRINPSFYSTLQRDWDRYKSNSNMHLIVCGSILHLMKQLFESEKEPLFGRADFKFHIKPFSPNVLREILQDNQQFTPKNWLDFYQLTGGVAKYIDLFCLHDAFSFEQILDVVLNPYAIFLEEGRNRLIEEFGSDNATYFSILSLMASSKTSKSELESIIPKSLSAYLNKLEYDYAIIESLKPIGSKPNSKLQKYKITDLFLAFWFRFIFKHQSLIESGNFSLLRSIIERDIQTYSGPTLERLYSDLLKHSGRFSQIGSWWDRSSSQEIDIVAIDSVSKTLLIAEIKLKAERLNPNELIRKATKVQALFPDYKPDYRLWSLENLTEVTEEFKYEIK